MPLSDGTALSFDAPPSGDVDPTVGGGGVVRARPVPPLRVRAPKPRVRPVAAQPGWGLALGIASSASVLVAAMGALSMVGAAALVMLA